jgi:hypothetical protein
MRTAFKHPRLWLAWFLGSMALMAGLAWAMIGGQDETVFMPGPLSPGHHQLALACEACHREPYGGDEVLQEACLDCHGAERRKPFDTHPQSKFKDPRNADRLGNIDALACVTCHVEHKPEITHPMGVTRESDFCVHCHGDIAEERPSHEGMGFETCASAGCHNFHDNRALYTRFLLKHLDEPEVLEQPVVPGRELATVLAEIVTYPHERYPVAGLTVADADAPARAMADAGLVNDWLETAHGGIGANCSACHRPPGEEGKPGVWTDHPDHTACSGCHDAEVGRFLAGKHGMRLKLGREPMTPAQARLPMHTDAAHRELTCTTCHGAHRFDVVSAAVDACLECHNDGHSLAYVDSPHHRLWQQASAGALAPGSGVSCATCHMPRVDYDVSEWLRRVMVEHNQNATLTPNEKMLRPVCLHCHGLQFSLDALADPAMVANNYRGTPSVHIPSLEMAEADRAAKGGDADTSMFGF